MRRKKERERSFERLHIKKQGLSALFIDIYWLDFIRFFNFFSFSYSTPFSLTDLLHQICIQRQKKRFFKHTSSGKATCLPSNRSLYRGERREEKGWVMTQLQLCWRPQSRGSLRATESRIRNSIAWEDSRWFPLEMMWETNTEIPHWWRVTTRISVVLLIGRVARKMYSENLLPPIRHTTQISRGDYWWRREVLAVFSG